MTLKQNTTGFGLLVIGNEILDGRRQDAHFTYARDLLHEFNLDLNYALILPDRDDVLRDQLRWAMGRPAPFFCCGGIGSTPDDLTRQSAAAAAGVELARHAEAVRILKARFGEENATETRLRMVDFPAGAALIPNPVNQVPGFSIANGYFFPGFPEMARPMMRWVLETCYLAGQERTRCTLRLPGAKEADLVDVMEAFIVEHPALSFSSLPRFTETGTEVLLGLHGVPNDVAAGLNTLETALDAAGVEFEVVPEPAKSKVSGNRKGASIKCAENTAAEAAENRAGEISSCGGK